MSDYNGLTCKVAKKGDRIAVIGSGIAGLSAAWLLSYDYDVTVFEADRRPGGHSNTVMTPAGDAVDTGFIVYNDWTYPNLIQLFDHLGVKNFASKMSFAVSLHQGGLEYSGNGLKGLFAQKSNLFRPRFHRMWRDILRFYREAPADLAAGKLYQISLDNYLVENHYSQGFIEDHLLPMGAAIWSGSMEGMKSFPAESFVRFFRNHGLMLLKDRPQWRTVKGGSWAYVNKLTQATPASFRMSCPVHKIRQQGDKIEVTFAQGETELYDHVILGCHSDQALKMLQDATPQERSILGALPYQTNIAYLHQDTSLMPRRKSVWSSWNYMGERELHVGSASSITYWMNNLQDIPEKRPYFVTLNPLTPPDEKKIIAQFDYQHPVFDMNALKAQSRIGQIQGNRGIWFCGAYSGFGFHEDGLASGLSVAEHLGGGRRPWQVKEISPAGLHVTPISGASSVAA